ncbi:hypothetical protein AAZV13_14G108250 [Glycine max]
MKNDEGSSFIIPPKPLNKLSTLDKFCRVSHAAIERTSQFLKSIGFKGSKINRIEVVRVGRQIIGLDGYGIGSNNESGPSFICDRDMASKLELHEAPNLEDV